MLLRTVVQRHAHRRFTCRSEESRCYEVSRSRGSTLLGSSANRDGTLAGGSLSRISQATGYRGTRLVAVEEGSVFFLFEDVLKVETGECGR